MALFDEEASRKTKDLIVGEDLSRHSIEELEERTVILQGEIERIAQALVDKRESMGAADSFFKR